MTDLSQPASPSGFDLEFHSEIVKTRCFGDVTVRDVGADTLERIATRSADLKDIRAMMADLLCEAATGANGERFTPDLLARLPARAFQDRINLLNAVARVNGVSADDVGKA
ncbi:hypothetical protein [Paraburkholderia sp.]|jgi:hypothetical protein|uniref:hypothetical protein n=1 Tax=Paraburkholderia sp. TaxID=1926495 RepID=UPI002F3F815B